MMTLRHAPIVAAMVVALLACNGNSTDPVTAANVTYDPAASALAATAVQAALDELSAIAADAASTRSDHTKRLTAAEDAVADLQKPLAVAAADVSFDATDTSLTGANLQVALAEVAGSADANAASISDFDGVLAAIAALEAKVEAGEAELAAVKADLAALTAKTDPDTVPCPDGMHLSDGFCIDTEARTPTTWDSAASECAYAGGTLCSGHRYTAACKNSPTKFPTEPEMVDDHLDTNTILLLSKCDIPDVGNEIQVFPFRCCIDRAQLVYSAPQ